MPDVPWKDVAIVSISDGSFRKIIAEGSLHTVLDRLDPLQDANRTDLVIAFPERRRPPFRYTQDDLDTLRSERLSQTDSASAQTWDRTTAKRARR